MAYLERVSCAWTDDSVRLIATPSPFAKASLFYVQEIGRFRTLATYYTEREHLDSYLVVYTLGGKGKLRYRGGSFELATGQAFWIDCRERHLYETDPDELWELLWVHWNGGAVRGYYEAYREAERPVLTLPLDSDVPRLLQELLDLQAEKSVASELIGSKLLVGLMTELLLASGGADVAGRGAPRYVQDIRRELELNFAQPVRLDELAARHAVSKYYLVAQFKRYTGFTPLEYAINCRMTRAKELLQYSELPVAAIAAAVGVPNVSHFIRLFKARVEDTPLSFRKKWQRPFTKQLE